MPASLNFHQRRWRCSQCLKVAYLSEERASDAAYKIGSREPMRPYFDQKCGWWHISRRDGLEWYMAEKALRERSTVQSNIVLRDYQEAAIQHVYSYFREEQGNPLIALPTGTGKSIIIAEFIRRAVTQYPHTRVMALTHVKELIDQNFNTLISMWPTAPSGIYSAGIGRRDTDTPITFAGIQSVHKKPEIFGRVDLVFIDEAHLVSNRSASMYQRFVAALREANPRLKVIGCTATPYRLSQGMLTEGALFDDVAFDLTSRDAFNWLIAQGWLARLIPKRTGEQLDVAGVRMAAGEFVLKDLQDRVDRESVTMAALSEAAHLARERKHWLVFASGVEHSEHVAHYLQDRFNITASFVHSKISTEERDQRLRDFKAGRIQAMVNNNILTTGFDYPDIDCIVMLRPTASPGLWVQMLGRGTRPAEGKTDCLVLDFAGNTARLGPINDPVLPRKKGKGPKGIAPVRLCENCGCYSHASCRFCENPHCGMEFPKNVKISAAASMAELIAGSLPDIHEYDVTKVIYQIHHKKGKPDSMRVTYYCGIRRFNEYICLDHKGYARRLASMWWRDRSPWGIPPNVHEGMKAVDYLRIPKSITVLDKPRYPEIAGYEFDN